MAKRKHFTFDLLFMAPKVEGQEQKLFSFGTPSIELGSAKHGP
jgi:hypothetical protein